MSLGFIALGAFIGGIVGVFLVNTSDWSKPATGLTTVLAAAVSGAPIALAQSILGNLQLSAAMAMYPVGLVLGILSPFLKYAAQNLASGTVAGIFLGIAHLLGYAALMSFGLSVFIFPDAVTDYLGRIDEHFARMAEIYSESGR